MFLSKIVLISLALGCSAEVRLLEATKSDLGADYPLPPPPFDEEFNYPKDSKVAEVSDNNYSATGDTFRSLPNQVSAPADRYTSASKSSAAQAIYQPNLQTYKSPSRPSADIYVYSIEPQELQLYKRQVYRYTLPAQQAYPSYNQGLSPSYSQGASYNQGSQPSYNQGSQPSYNQGAQPSYNKGASAVYTSTIKDSTGYHYNVPRNPLKF